MLQGQTARSRPLIYIAGLVLTAALGLAACGGDSLGPGAGGSNTCTSYSLAVTAGSVQLTVGQQTTLTAKVGTCTTRRVLWAVTDSAVLNVAATSDTSATVTARAKGISTVLARLLADSVATQYQTVIQVQ